MSILEQLLEARDRDDPEAISTLIPYCGFLGMTARRVDGDLRLHLPFQPHQIGNPAIPALHGGTVGSMLETIAIFQVLWAHDVVSVPRTINLTVDYQRPGRPVETWAHARVAKRGRRVFSVVSEAWQDEPDRPISTALVHLLVKTREE